MANVRVMRGAPATITTSFPDQHGEPRLVASATVQARRADGSVLFASRPAVVGADGELDEVSTELSETDTGSLDELRITFSAGGSTVEAVVDVVGRYYFSIAAAREAQSALRKDVAKYPDETLIHVRQLVEEECELLCGRAFVPRYGRIVLDGTGCENASFTTPDLRVIRSVSVDGTAVDMTGMTYDVTDGIVWPDGYFPAGRRNVVVEFEYGMDSPPADLVDATITRLRNRLNRGQTSLDPRMTSMSNEHGTWSLATPGQRGAMTGLPEVDEVYARYSWRGAESGSVRIR